MKKKMYQAPEIKVCEMEATPILVGSDPAVGGKWDPKKNLPDGYEEIGFGEGTATPD